MKIDRAILNEAYVAMMVTDGVEVSVFGDKLGPNHEDQELFVRHIRAEYLTDCPYHEYLQSEEWKERRERVLLQWEHRCSVCNSSEGLDVHHRNYDNRARELPNDLIVLCRSCHSLFHSNGKLA